MVGLARLWRINGPWEFLIRAFSQRVGSFLGLLDALFRDIDVQTIECDLACSLVFDATQQFAQDAKTRRYDTAGRSRVHAFGQNIRAQLTGQVAAQ